MRTEMGRVRERALLDWLMWVRIWWVEIRPKQWLKNFLVLAPLIFSLNLFNQVAVVQSCAMFALFCLISSSVYLLNDIQDYEQDRLHPIKRYRPIASGAISMASGFFLMITLLLIALGGGIVLSFQAFLVLLAYWLINLLYSSGLKHQVLLDVFALASGFVLRVVGGAVVIEVAISPWLLLCTLLLALFLGFGKRRHELVLLGDRASEHRQVLSEYNILFLDMMIAVLTACTIMTYALYTVSEVTVRQFNTEGLLLTLPFVLFGIFRYLYLVYHKQRGGDPTQTLFSDPQVVLTLFFWGVTVGIIIYR
jgi:4-hydroxybenzoate polyprenyltransferase